jgi:hypothetical protein
MATSSNGFRFTDYGARIAIMQYPHIALPLALALALACIKHPPTLNQASTLGNFCLMCWTLSQSCEFDILTSIVLEQKAIEFYDGVAKLAGLA